MDSVYGLVDSKDKDIPFYVGITKDVEYRLDQHLRCDGSNKARDQRIQGILAIGGKVELVVFEEVDKRKINPRIREAYWIHHFLDLGIPLTNEHIPSRDVPNLSNREKYVRITIDVPRGGFIHLAMLKEVEEVEGSTLSLLASIRLQRCYELRKRGIT